MTLLIVDDNAAVRRVIRSILAYMAEEIYECSDGREALASYNAHPPDYVLMDIEMKALDGIKATMQIRAAHPDAQVIIITNYDDVGLRNAADGAGACAYVLKENLYEIARAIELQQARGRNC